MVRRVAYSSIWAIPIVLTLITDSRCRKELRHRTRRDNRGNFEVLLNYYKLNPIKQSTIFKEFSNRMLEPKIGTREVDVMHIDSNESVRENQAQTNLNLKQIEDAIHVTRSTHKELGPPSFNVEDVVPEDFSKELAYDFKRFSQNYKLIKAKKEKEIFDELLGHINSDEIADKETINDKTAPYNDQNRNQDASVLKIINSKLSVLEDKGHYSVINYPDTGVISLK